jgi:Flp pilus assembly protein TadD
MRAFESEAEEVHLMVRVQCVLEDILYEQRISIRNPQLRENALSQPDAEASILAYFSSCWDVPADVGSCIYEELMHAKNLLRQDRYMEACILAQRIASENKKVNSALYVKAVAYSRLGQVEQAFHAASQVDPEQLLTIEELSAIGSILAQGDAIEKAEHFFALAAQMKLSSETLSNLAYVLNLQGKVHYSYRLLQYAVSIRPLNVFVLFCFCYACYKTRRLHQAEICARILLCINEQKSSAQIITESIPKVKRLNNISGGATEAFIDSLVLSQLRKLYTSAARS